MSKKINKLTSTLNYDVLLKQYFSKLNIIFPENIKGYQVCCILHRLKQIKYQCEGQEADNEYKLIERIMDEMVCCYKKEKQNSNEKFRKLEKYDSIKKLHYSFISSKQELFNLLGLYEIEHVANQYYNDLILNKHIIETPQGLYGTNIAIESIQKNKKIYPYVNSLFGYLDLSSCYLVRKEIACNDCDMFDASNTEMVHTYLRNNFLCFDNQDEQSIEEKETLKMNELKSNVKYSYLENLRQDKYVPIYAIRANDNSKIVTFAFNSRLDKFIHTKEFDGYYNKANDVNSNLNLVFDKIYEDGIFKVQELTKKKELENLNLNISYSESDDEIDYDAPLNDSNDRDDMMYFEEDEHKVSLLEMREDFKDND